MLVNQRFFPEPIDQPIVAQAKKISQVEPHAVTSVIVFRAQEKVYDQVNVIHGMKVSHIS